MCFLVAWLQSRAMWRRRRWYSGIRRLCCWGLYAAGRGVASMCANWHRNAGACVTAIRNLNGTCLVHLIHLGWHIFQFRNIFHCANGFWWNMPLKGTRHSDGVADVAVAMCLWLGQHALSIWLHSVRTGFYWKRPLEILNQDYITKVKIKRNDNA